MTFLELCKLLRAEAGISGDGPVSVINQTGINLKIVNWIQRAYQEVQNEHHDWAFLWSEASFALTPGKTDYAPTSDMGLDDFNHWEPQSFFGRGQTGEPNRLIAFVPFEEFRLRSRVERTGEPLIYTILPNDQIRFDCKPTYAEVVDFEYYRVPFQMSANTDAPIFSAQFHDILLYKALMYYAADEEASAILQDAAVNYKTRLRMLESIDRQQPYMTMQSLA